MKKLICLLLAAALLGAPVAAYGAAPEENVPLVTDAFSLDYGDEWGSYGFHVPQINWEGSGIQAVNDAIWQQRYEGELAVEGGALAAVDGGWSPEPYSMDYSWTVNGDILSLLVRSSYSGDYDVFSVYNVSLSACRRITDSELIGLLGMDQDGFYALAGQVLADTFEQFNSVIPVDSDYLRQELDRARTQNNDAANIHAVQPYLNEDGSLYMIGKLYTLAGGGELNGPMPLLARDQLPETISSADLPEAPELDPRLADFIDGCDSRYFTEADLEGFDEEMCLYARNSIFAKLGWKFESVQLQDFFSRFDWYTPTLDPAQFTADMLNDCQQSNVALVLAYEAEHGY